MHFAGDRFDDREPTERAIGTATSRVFAAADWDDRSLAEGVKARRGARVIPGVRQRQLGRVMACVQSLLLSAVAVGKRVVRRVEDHSGYAPELCCV